MTPLLEVGDLFFSYNGRPVLEGVNLTLYQHDYLALLGPNGGGKTTLLKLVLGLLQPEAGRIRLKGRQDVERERFIGYLPQHAAVKDSFPLKVFDAVLMGLVDSSHRGCSFGRRDRERVRTALERVEMADYQEELLHNLSGGQRQRVFIARSLVSDPELLILDEPASSIDPQARFCFYEFLAELKHRITIIMVTHDLSLSAAGVNKFATLNRWLIMNSEPRLTGEMMELMYGSHHDHTCPMDQVLREPQAHLGGPPWTRNRSD